MPISERKLIALGKNAQKSTGPKTAIGKFRSSRNALKHGYYSKFNLTRAFMLIPRKDWSRFLTLLNKQFRGVVTGYESKLPKKLRK